MPARLLRAATVAWVLALVALCAAALAGPSAHAADGSGERPAAGQPIDDYRYDRAKRCREAPTPGALAMVNWLERNSRGALWGIVRCSKLGKHDFSLHAEGRAIDWHLSVHRPADRRDARRLIGLLLAEDSAGNRHALARRMGVQEIIWDCRSWWSGMERMGPYSTCVDSRGRRKRGVSDTLAHRDQIHIGLNLEGARKRTSFWRR